MSKFSVPTLPDASSVNSTPTLLKSQTEVAVVVVEVVVVVVEMSSVVVVVVVDVVVDVVEVVVVVVGSSVVVVVVAHARWRMSRRTTSSRLAKSSTIITSSGEDAMICSCASSIASVIPIATTRAPVACSASAAACTKLSSSCQLPSVGYTNERNSSAMVSRSKLKSKSNCGRGTAWNIMPATRIWFAPTSSSSTVSATKFCAMSKFSVPTLPDASSVNSTPTLLKSQTEVAVVVVVVGSCVVVVVCSSVVVEVVVVVVASSVVVVEVVVVVVEMSSVEVVEVV